MAELKFYGANSFELKTKNTTVLIDPYDETYGKQVSTKDKIVILTQTSSIDVSQSAFVVSTPGEYEISKVSIYGIAASPNTAYEGSTDSESVIYRLVMGDTSMGIIGNINPRLSDGQLEALGVVDYLIIAAGGHGLSIEPIDAAKLVATIEPKVVIASHFADDSINYPVPQEDVSVFAKELGLEVNKQAKIKLSHANTPEELELIVLEKAN